VLATIQRLRLFTDEAPEGPLSLPRLCAEGLLAGGLSVALDVRPDELFGALAEAVGGPAKRLKVLDVRDRPSPRMVVTGGPPAAAETWEVPDLPSLVERLNQRVAGHPDARPCAVLGEWDDALQLWCLPRTALRALLQEQEFRPENLAQLRRLATS
jgi:hypothetical protein